MVKQNEDVADRRRQEDTSPRLRDVVPLLRSLRLELSESRGQGQIESTHIKRIVVEHAPAVFLIPCGEPRCKHGSFDITPQVLSGLRRGEARIEADDTCRGDVGSAACDRILHCVAVAEYAS